MEFIPGIFKLPSIIITNYKNPIFSRLYISISSFSSYSNQESAFHQKVSSFLDQRPKNLNLVKSIHAQIILCSCQTDKYLITKLIKAYADLSDLAVARKVFDQFPQPHVSLSNAMMNGYVKNDKHDECIDFFKEMRFLGLEIDECTCNFAIKACAVLLDYEYGMGIVERVLERGRGVNVFLGSSMINFLVKFDHLDEARRLFDEMRGKDVVSWNTMIRGYVKVRRFKEAVRLFCDMRGCEIRPSSVTMLSLIQALEGVGNLVLGKCAHGYVLQLGLGNDVMSLTALVNMYGKMGDIVSSSSVFERISGKSLVSWNAMISAYVQNGCASESFALLQRLVFLGIQFDSVTVVSLLQGCSLTSDLKSGKTLHGFILRRKYLDLNVILLTSLLALYSKCGALESAKRIFVRMKEKNVVTWTALLVGLAQNGYAEDALRLFCRMQGEGVPANSVTLVSLIHSCAHLGSLRKGKSVHTRLFRGGFSLDEVSVTALLDMYSKCGKINYAEKIFDYGWMSRDVILWNSMISGYGLHGNGRRAINLFTRMIDEGVKPNETTFVSVLVACSHSGMVEEGTDLFNRMERVYNIRPVDKHYACYVDILSRAGRLDEAEAFITKMPLDPQSDVLESLLNGCRFYKNIDIGVRTADKLLGLDYVNPGIYIVLSNIYAEMKRWDAVNYVRDLMRSRAVKKTPGYSAIEIGNSDYTFFAGDDSHPEWDKIYQLLKSLREAAEASGYVADTNCVLRDVDEEKKVSLLWGHSERLAIAFGLLHTPAGSVIRIRKNLRVCNDCHNVTKFISKLVQREIVVRDANRFHHFVDGVCSCTDYWQVTFSKRRAGLLKKARELSVLCDAEVAVIIFSSTGRLFEYASQSMQRTIARYNKSVDQRETKEEPDHEVFQASLVTADATFTPEVQLLTNVEKPYADKEKEKETVKDKENNKEKEKDKANEKLKEKEKEKKNHEAKELDILKQEIENLKLKQSQLLGNDLNCVGLKELLQLEQQLNQALISIKNKKEQILMNQLERAKAKEEQMKLENTTLREQVQELLGKIPPNGHALPLYLDYPSELYNPIEKDGIGSADTICNDEVANEYSDTTLQLGPPSGISRKRKAPEGESHCSHFGSGM